MTDAERIEEALKLVDQGNRKCSRSSIILAKEVRRLQTALKARDERVKELEAMAEDRRTPCV